MYDFDSLLAELLASRPEISREELLDRIAKKKEAVGAGYLTDQGALFLVAGDLGVKLSRDSASSDLGLKDLYIGANDVTVVARVLSVYPVSTYNKKDGSTGKYRRLVLFDGGRTVRLTVWDEKADEVEKITVAPDSPVRISNAYVKQGLDGKPNLNLGRRGDIQVVDGHVAAKLPALSTVVEKLSKLTQEKQFVAVEGVVDSEPRYSEFVRSDGSPGSLFQFGVVADLGKVTRFVIWSPTSQPELKRGQRVVVTNVRSKRASTGEFEIHGDAGSAITIAQKRAPVQLRVAAVSSGTSGTLLLAVDEDRKVRVVEVAKGVGAAAAKGDAISIMPDSESDGRAFCRSPGSLQVVKDATFPGLADLATKLRDSKDESAQIMVEVIALSHGGADDIKLKDGTIVKKGELVVGDDTAEFKVVAWRDLSEKLAGIQPGERLRITGTSPKSMKMGGWVLQVSNITAVEKLRGRD